jgi:glucose dehydrogenase
VYQAPVAGNWQTTPLVVDGMMYITQRPNDVGALDPLTGRVFWIYRYTPNPDRIVCLRANNRGSRSWRHAVHGHAGRTPDCHRSRRPAGDVEDRGRHDSPATRLRTHRWS